MEKLAIEQENRNIRDTNFELQSKARAAETQSKRMAADVADKEKQLRIMTDQNSELLLGSLQTHPKCRISLFQRTFLTVPYLGKGPFNPDLESKLQQTDTFSNNKKSINTVSEVSYMPLTNYPLIPAIQDTITNPTYLVEGVASNGWVRGGIPSRAMSKAYVNK